MTVATTPEPQEPSRRTTKSPILAVPYRLTLLAVPAIVLARVMYVVMTVGRWVRF